MSFAVENESHFFEEPCLSDYKKYITVPQCNLDRGVEMIVSTAMKEEEEAFQNGVWTPLFEDNQSHPESVAEIGTHALRKHKKCLQEICQQVFEKCYESGTSRPRSASNVFEEIVGWCYQRVDKLDQINQTKLEVFSNANQARKDRSLLRHKLVAIESRFDAYFQYWMPKTVGSIQKIVAKILWFIAMPF